MSRDERSGERRARAVARPVVRPGPLADLKEYLYFLHLDAGMPSMERIAGLIAADESLPGMPGKDTVHRCLASDALGSQADVVSVAMVLAREAHHNRDDAARRVRDLWVRARTRVPAGEPLEKVTDPFAMGVHPAIEVSAVIPVLTLLPAYVRRAHDIELEEQVRQAAEGESAIAVLVGDSSVGKTRTCWEALGSLRRAKGWRLWHPADARTALEQLGEVTARTVIWLDETRGRHLAAAGGAGEELASGLRELLHDPARGPVLELFTMWDSDWNLLTTEPPAGNRNDDWHRHARSLLAHHAIPVPTEFSSEDLRTLRSSAARDPRLAEAAAQAADGQITQYLAGVPVLLERYRLAPDGARALILAALDAFLLGLGPELPLTLLRAAAPGYLSDTQWRRITRDPEWLERALDYTDADCRGTFGPLIRCTLQSGEPGGEIADYLQQHAGSIRQQDSIPDALLGAIVDQHDVMALALSARRRGLLRYAFLLYAAAAQAGYPHASAAIAAMLEQAGRIDEAIIWWQRDHDEDESAGRSRASNSAEHTADLLESAGRIEDAITWWQRAAKAGNHFAPENIIRLTEETGQFEEAAEWLLRNSAQLLPGSGEQAGGDMSLKAFCSVHLARLLVRAGRLSEAMEWWHRSLTVSKIPLDTVEDLIAAAGQIDEARAWLREHAGTINANALGWMEHGLTKAHDHASEESDPGLPAQRQADANQDVNSDKRPAPPSTDHRERRLRVFREEFGENFAEGAAQVLGKLRRIIESGIFVGHDLDIATDLLCVTGRPDEAIDWCKRAAENPETDYDGGLYATDKAAELLIEAGRTDQAIGWLQASAEDRGNHHAMTDAAKLLVETGRVSEAIAWLQARARAGESQALPLTAHILAETGQQHDSELLRKYGWGPDGSIAGPWPPPPA